MLLKKREGKVSRVVLPRAQVAEHEVGQEEEDGARFPRKTARLVVASPLDRIRDLRYYPQQGSGSGRIRPFLQDPDPKVFHWIRILP